MPADPHVVRFVRTSGLERDALVESEDGRLLVAHRSGACIFRIRERCAIHEQQGEAGLPVACRHFPRVVLRDARGTLVSFSHYCPTAAALLVDAAGPVCAVTTAQPIAPAEPVEGLDARDCLPPLLNPEMLADIRGYDAWEQTAIRILTTMRPVARALEIIESATERTRRWTPSLGVLTQHIDAAFAQTEKCRTNGRESGSELAVVRELYPGDLSLRDRTDVDVQWNSLVAGDREDLQRPLANYLAARLFANWVAYQGEGLRSVVAWLRACYDVVRVLALQRRDDLEEPLTVDALLEAIRGADLIMLHTIDSADFARCVRVFEEVPAA